MAVLQQEQIVLDIPLNIMPLDLSLESIADGLKQYLIGSIIFAIICGLTVSVLTYLLLLIIRKQKR